MSVRCKRYAEPRMALALQQVEAGTPVADLCQKMGPAEATFRRTASGSVLVLSSPSACSITVCPDSSLGNTTPEELVCQALGADRAGVGTTRRARREGPNGNGRGCASEAEHSHCRRHQDGGKSKVPKSSHSTWTRCSGQAPRDSRGEGEQVWARTWRAPCGKNSR